MKNSLKLRKRYVFNAVSLATLAGIASGLNVSAQANDVVLTPTLGGANSAYTLNEVQTKTDNSFTLYKYNPTSGLTEAINYEVNLKQTTYGSGDTEKYYKWVQFEGIDEELDKKIPVDVYNLVTATKDDAQLTLKYDSENPPKQFAVSANTDNISGNFVGYNETVINVNDEVTLNNLSGSFVANNVPNGLIYTSNNAIIGSIEADFVGNSTIAAVIMNDGKINAVKGDFIGNIGRDAGAIINGDGDIDSITGNFIGNASDLFGGAITNVQGTIDTINGNFYSNKVLSGGQSDLTIGGAILNLGTINTIKGDFVNNSIEAPLSYSGANMGGAIFSASGYGGYYGTSIISQNMNIHGNLINNHIKSEAVYSGYYGAPVALGGAMYVSGGLELDEKFLNGSDNPEDLEKVLEKAMENGDIVGLVLMVPINIVKEDGSIYYSGTLAVNEGFKEGTEPKTNEELVELISSGKVLVLNAATSIQPEVVLFGALPYSYLESVVAEENEKNGTSYTVEEFLNSEQGAENFIPEDLYSKYLDSIYKNINTSEDVRKIKTSATLHNSDIIGNYLEAKDEGIEASDGVKFFPVVKGGAIYGNFANIKINADDGNTHYISGNYVKVGDNIDDNAIYMNGGKLIFDVTNGSTIQLDDNIRGVSNYHTYFIGDNTSNFVLNNKIYNSNTHLFDTNLYLVNDENLDGNNLNLHSGQLSMITNQAGVSALNSLTVVGDTNVMVDVDLKNKTMDRFTASEYGSHSGNLNVTGVNLLSDAVSDKTEILFAEQGLKDNVTYGGGELPQNEFQTTAYTPIYKYNVAYDNKDDAGYFVFSRGGNVGGADSFNPAILGSSTSATVGAVGTINQTFNHAFSNADTTMNIPYLERISMKTRNRYALSVTGDSVDVGRYSPLYQPSDEESSVWVKPYAAFETVDLKNGPKVHNNTYGTLIGFDTEMKSLRRGWDRVLTGYIGYNGASQRYAGIDSTQNGGLIGGTMTLYKGNFFNATTLSVGANVAQNETMYGKEDFAMLLSGIGNKTGYNFEFKEGKVILQPSMLMSYTFVNTFDYTNAAGVRVENKPLHALQLAPGVKVIGNLKNGWQPYASVQMVWNLMGETNATADGVKLPEMSIKPYVQYGVGVQKRIKDHFTAYGQAMVQNGGRNGISLTAGFRWALGHDNCKYEKTQRHNEVKAEGSLTSKEILRSAQNDRGKYTDNKTSSLDVGGVMPRAAEHKKILKQMTPQQKMAHGGKYMNTSRTAKSGSLRQY